MSEKFDYRHASEERIKQRAEERAKSLAVLKRRGINYQSLRGGVRLLVTHGDRRYDFWPATGRFRKRPSSSIGRFGESRLVVGTGVDALLKELGLGP